MSRKIPSFTAFGRRLADLRRAAGLAQQTDLAVLLSISPQAVSRWEAGLSRPRQKQIPVLARVLKADPEDLLLSAGYSTKTVVATFDRPFPVEALSPDSFERFSLHLISALYPSPARVHAAGGQGHTQDGLDIRAVLADGSVHTFQCKRVDEFGPQKVHAAVARHAAVADKKFLLLSRVASPQAREAISQHKDWDIWDRDDISLRIRQLPKEAQRRIVDTFFQGRRLELLGETEVGPWQTAEEFFASFTAEKRRAFSHRWQLVGRDEELKSLVEKLADSQLQVVLLVGAGGAGKSRLLKQAIESFSASAVGRLVRFLSPTEDVTAKSLGDLGDGEKVLIVDDAHDRNDLPQLFQYAAIPQNKATLLLVCRPYGLDYIKREASAFSLAGPRVAEVRLRPLSAEQATELAREVLKEFGGPLDVAQSIARLSYDCPLATVMGAQVLASPVDHLELIKNEDLFRTTLLSKFQDVIAGKIGTKADAEPIRKLLRVLALVQPFHPEDQSVAATALAVEGMPVHETSRLIKLLNDAGVLFKRGGQYRLSPDLLADYIIENTCIGSGGTSTGYAETVFDAASERHAGNLLLNLGRLDWRLSNRDPSHSRLLDGVWSKLNPTREYGDPHIEAVAKVAYFQPARSLRFADQLIREGRHLRDLPKIIKYAAYNFEHLANACELLWELGKDDKRELPQHPDHAIRILSELAAVEPNKPVEYNKVVVDFGLVLLARDDVWGHSYSPLDILKGALRGDGHISEAKGAAIEWTRFAVRHEAVAGLRRKVADAAIGIFSNPDVKRASAAARFLGEALRYPMDIHPKTRPVWAAEFVETLNKLQVVVSQQKADLLVLIAIGHAVSWHAHYGDEPTKPLAQKLLASLPTSLEFRTTLVLVDGYGYLLRRLDDKKQQQQWNDELEQLIKDLIAKFPDSNLLRKYIGERLAYVEANDDSRGSSPFLFVNRLINAAVALARSIIEDALAVSKSGTRRFAGYSLATIMAHDRQEADGFMARMLATGSFDLLGAIGNAYSCFDLNADNVRQQDLSVLQRLLGSQYEIVVLNALAAIRNVAKIDQRLAIKLLLFTNVTTPRVAEGMFVLFAGNQTLSVELLTGEDVDAVLAKLKPLASIDGYWTAWFLAAASKLHGMKIADFLMGRLDYSADTQRWEFRPSTYGAHGPDVRYKFRESPEFGPILTKISNWMKSRPDDYMFNSCAADLFETMFAPFDDDLIAPLQDWLDRATADDMDAISIVLSKSSHGDMFDQRNVPERGFVFEHRAFVERFLGRAQQFGKEVVDKAINALWSAEALGLRSGIPGQPFPRDLKMKEEAEKALKEVPRFSPAYQLYDTIQKTAEANIRQSMRDAEALET